LRVSMGPKRDFLEIWCESRRNETVLGVV